MWNQLPQPIKLLAPMAGYTDSVFRTICREQGANVVMTELISADAIYFALKKSSFCHPEPPLCHPELAEGSVLDSEPALNSIQGSILRDKFRSSKTYELMKFSARERPIVIQLFGKDIERFLIASEFIAHELKADGIDINMGCAVRKVVRSGHGAALLKDEFRALEIVSTLSKKLSIPISVKTRLGFNDPKQIISFGPKLISAGAQAVTVHGRTATQGFAGEADWEPIYQLKEKSPQGIIIGNGDINSYEDIKVKIGNLDGVAIGRAALSKPWIFSGRKPSLKEIVELARKQAKENFQAKGEHGIIEMRKHLIWYFKGLPNASDLRSSFVEVKTMSDVEKVLDCVIRHS